MCPSLLKCSIQMILSFDISCKDSNAFNNFSFIILFNLKKKYYIVVEMIAVTVLYKRK